MNIFTLWENEDFAISTPKNPQIPYSEAPHIIVSPKQEVPSAWADPDLAGRAFTLSARACKIMEEVGIAPWFNLQANGNWGLLPGNTPFFHIHIYGRKRESASWAKPLVLPEAPGSYEYEPMPEAERAKLIDAFKALG